MTGGGRLPVLCLLGLLAVTAIAGVSVAAGGADAATTTGAVEAATSTTDAVEDGRTRNDSARSNVQDALLRAIEADDATGDGPSIAAHASQSTTAGVRVVIEATPGRGDAAHALVAERGEVEVRHGARIQATVPRDSVVPIGEEDAVSFVRLPNRVVSHEMTSEGVETIRADVAHDRGRTGDGATVAVLDQRFDPDHAPIADRIVEMRDFRADGSGFDGSATSRHGDGSAALVVDVAPDADLVLVTAQTGTELLNAIEWIDEHDDIDAVSMSIGFRGGVRNDGGSDFDRAIDDSVANGTAWFASAGNEATAHWGGEWRDEGGTDGVLTFDGTGDDADECNELSAGGTVDARLQWNDWPDSDQDYDLALDIYRDGSYADTVVSDNVQASGTGAPPTERIRYAAHSDDDYYCLRIIRFDADGTASFNLFTGSHSPEYVVPAGSITPPATAENAVAVGGVGWDDQALAPYSSRGPTVDGRLKPEIAAPTGVSTEAYGETGYHGTSAAAPHVAGAAAVTHAANGTVRGSDLHDRLLTTSVAPAGDDYDAFPNNRVGHGLVDVTNAIPPQDPTNTSVAGPIEAADADAVEVNVTFPSPPKPGTLLVRLEDESGTAVTANRSLDTNQSTMTVTVDARPLDDGEVVASATAVDTFGWRNTASFTAFSTVTMDAGTVAAAALSTTGPTEVGRNSTFDVAYELANVGDENGTTAELAIDLDALPGGVAVVDGDSPDGTVSATNGTVNWTTGGPLESGKTGEATFTFAVASDAPLGPGTITANATVGSATNGTTHDVDVVEEGSPTTVLQAIAAQNDPDDAVDFQDVLASISAFNEGRQVDGFDVGFRDVLDAISAFNDGAAVGE